MRSHRLGNAIVLAVLLTALFPLCHAAGNVAEKVALDLGGETEQPLHERLSDREFEVLRLLASGKTISQLARQLHLSVATVSTYRARILEKMHLKNNAELMHYVLTNHLLD